MRSPCFGPMAAGLLALLCVSCALHAPLVARAPAQSDAASAHMHKLYEKYSRKSPAQGNTVRSFRARVDAVEPRLLFRFNLTSMLKSEVLLSASFNYFVEQRPRHRSWLCKRHRHPSCRSLLTPAPAARLLFRRSSSSILGNVTLALHRRGGGWLASDATELVKATMAAEDLLVSAEVDPGHGLPRQREYAPYLLVYADDTAIAEPNSVAASLQRYDPSPMVEDPAPSPNSSPEGRVRRSAGSSSNELPEAEFSSAWKNQELWESSYLPSKPEGKRRGPEDGEVGPEEHQELSFDEKTMRKARQRQRSEPRGCARRYLRVDFADIGWSEWVLAPKSFEAYYCAGACGFPMAKATHPSNHATIQSIVRAVGITPGVPEPCCVPDKMSTLSVLFLDEGKNMVLKVYPGMSVETCSCR